MNSHAGEDDEKVTEHCAPGDGGSFIPIPPGSEGRNLIGHVGSNGGSSICGIMFHLTKARKMLASVDKLIEAGNEVCLGEESFIRNVQSKQVMPLVRKNGVFVMEVSIRDGDEWKSGEIIVDSGAAECVMPVDWLLGVEVAPKKPNLRFTGADGSDLGNFGRKLVEFVPCEKQQQQQSASTSSFQCAPCKASNSTSSFQRHA